MNKTLFLISCTGITVFCVLIILNFTESTNAKTTEIECSLVKDNQAWNGYHTYYDKHHYFKIQQWSANTTDDNWKDCDLTVSQSILEDWLNR